MTRFAKGLAALLAALLLAAPALAQDARGNWQGALSVGPGVSLRLAIHIAADADGKFSGTMDSIDQGSFGIPLADVVQTADSFSFNVPSVGGRYEAKWDAAAKGWKGSWSQMGNNLPLAFAPAVPVAPPPPLPASWDIPADPAIAALIDTRIAARPGEGIVVGVIEPAGRRIVARGPASGAAFGPGTVFEIGSMTKVFTSLILADMVLRGEVSLDDPAAKYLPAGAKMPERGGRQITLRDLATHSSGLPRLPDNMPFGNPANPYADYTEAQMLEFLGRYQLPRDIGSKFEYSNLGVGLLGYLLARRAGTDYETLLKTRVLVPLGMADTAIALSAGQKARFAPGYNGLLQPASPWDLPTLAGAGAIRSTAQDMLTFLAAAMDTRPTPLAPAFKLMLAKLSPGPGPRVEIGLAWMVVHSPRGDIAFHDGGTGGFRTTMAYDPAKKRGVVVLTNAAREPSSNDLALHLLLGTPVTPP